MKCFSMGKALMCVLGAAVAAGVYLSAVPVRAAGEVEEDAAVLRKLDDEWCKAAVAKDVERLASFYAEDAVAYPPNEPMAVGKAAAKKVWASYFSEPSFTISWKTVHAGAAKSGELGYTAGTYEDSYKGADGKVVHEKGKYVCTWAKQKDGSWKAIHDIWNADAK